MNWLSDLTLNIQWTYTYTLKFEPQIFLSYRNQIKREKKIRYTMKIKSTEVSNIKYYLHLAIMLSTKPMENRKKMKLCKWSTWRRNTQFKFGKIVSNLKKNKKPKKLKATESSCPSRHITESCTQNVQCNPTVLIINTHSMWQPPFNFTYQFLECSTNGLFFSQVAIVERNLLTTGKINY